MTSPLISIITPMFNNGDVISQTIKSIINQTYQNWELLLIDDASSDSTLATVRPFIESDSRIKLYQHSENKGAAQARNLGTQKANGSYIAFLDADDLWLPNKLQRQLEELSNNTDVCFSSYEHINAKGEATGIKVHALPSLTYSKLLKSNYIGNLTGIYNCEALGKIYTKDIRKRQDWLLWLEALRKSQNPAVGIQETLALYRVNKKSLSSNKLNLIKHNFNVYHKGLNFSYFKSIIFILRFFYEHFLVKQRLIKSISTK